MADFPEISEVLRLLGIGGNYSGHRLTAAAVILTIKDPDRLLYVTNHLYWPVAQQHGCSWQCVERAIRSAAKRAWERNPDYLKELARYPMEKAPTASEFVDILASHFLRTDVQHPSPR